MSEAERLANMLCEKPDSDGHCRKAAAELRRLSAELDALKAAQGAPVAWIRPSGKAMLAAGGYCTVYASDGMSNHSTPLYTLNGIKSAG